MKKLLCILLAAVTALSMFSCGGELTEDTGVPIQNGEEYIDIAASGYKIVYDLSDPNAIALMASLQNDINEAVGYKPASLSSSNAPTEFEIQFGLKSGRSEAEEVYGEVSGYANAQRGAYVIRAVGNKVVVSASGKEALSLAAKELLSYAKDQKLVLSTKLDSVKVFDLEKYLKDGSVQLLDAEAIGSDLTLVGIKIDGESALVTDLGKTEFSFGAVDPASAEVELVTAESGVSISKQRNQNTVVITVTGINRKNEKVYTVNLYEKVNTEVVNKGGADATVTYVIDDGDRETAKFIVEQMAPKYASLTASFALITSKLATLDIVTNPDGTTEYAKDEDGFYTYTKNESEWSFWEELATNKRFELVSHSHTHKYWGETDEGGKFTYYNTAGESFVSDDFPKGSVSKEFVASKQIIQDLDPSQRASVFVRSGLTAGGSNVAYSDSFWTPIETSGAYIGARGTYTYPDTPEKMLNLFENFADSPQRSKLNSYMVQHYNTNPSVKTTQAGSGPKECLDAGIPYWTNYIDAAVENKAWAAFCIHTIRPDTHDSRSGHYIFRSQAEELFAYTDKLSQENKVWVAPVCEAMAYAIEWSSARSQAYLDGDKLTVTLDDEAEGNDFTVALTVKTELPAGKTSASVNGKAVKTVSENGKTYALVDVVPGTSVTLNLK